MKRIRRFCLVWLSFVALAMQMAIAAPIRDLGPANNATQEETIAAEPQGQVDQHQANRLLNDVAKSFTLFRQIIGDAYLNGLPDDQTIIYSVIKGFMESLDDPYSAFYTPDETKMFSEQMNGSFEGIGAALLENAKGAEITAVYKDSPAKKAGVKKGDIIVKVDSEVVVGRKTDYIAAKVRGVGGTKVTITVLRKGHKKPLDISIIRGKVSLNVDVTLAYKNDIAVITVPQFGGNTAGQFHASLDSALRKGMKGLVIDLRNNPGGMLDTCRDMLSAWLTADEPYILTESKHRQSAQYAGSHDVNDALRAKQYRVAILMNHGSASASEVFAGAMQDYGYAKVIGDERSFGKGLVQMVLPFDERTLDKEYLDTVPFLRGASLHLTTQRWKTPKGQEIHKKGIKSDIVVVRTEKDEEKGRDPQLKRALEYMRNGK